MGIALVARRPRHLQGDSPEGTRTKTMNQDIGGLVDVHHPAADQTTAPAADRLEKLAGGRRQCFELEVGKEQIRISREEELR